jgi:hypothetical protein
VVDFTGGALKKSKKANLFDDVIARRKDEGNYARLFLPIRSNEKDSRIKWMRLGMLGLTVVFATGMVLMMVLTRTPDGSEAISHQAVDGGKGKTGKTGKAGTAGGATAESGSPVLKAVPSARGRGQIPYRPPLPEFKPLEKLDADRLGNVWDSDRDLRVTPWIAHNIKGEHEIVDYIYRYLRTHTPEELAAKADPTLNHRDMMTSPGYHRGKVISMRVVVLRIFKIYGWYDSKDKNAKVPESGVLDTTMLFVRSADRRGTHIFVVLVAESPDEFRERDVYDLTGCFMKRFPYERKDNKWEAHPLLLTMKMYPAKVSPGDSVNLTVAIVLVAVIAMIVLYFAVRGETRESEEKRKERLERRKLGRDRLKQRLQTNRSNGGDSAAAASSGAESSGHPEDNDQ